MRLLELSVFGATCVLSDYTGRIIFGAIASADLPGTRQGSKIHTQFLEYVVSVESGTSRL